MYLKCALFTSTRADYGIMRHVALAMQSDSRFQLQVIVSGTHLLPEYGETKVEILNDRLPIGAEVSIELPEVTRASTVSCLADCTKKYSSALMEINPDLVLILGDRWEAFGMSQAARILGIPTAHFHGGELTCGSMDDYFRHCITISSRLHFVANEDYQRRVIQLGCHPENVILCGAPSLEDILSAETQNIEQIKFETGLPKNAKFFLATVHPDTDSEGLEKKLLEELFLALEAFPDHFVIFTYPNADFGRQWIIDRLKSKTKSENRFILVKSLGIVRFKTLLSCCDVFLGNSSSGIIEAPSLLTPSVNIGSRQEGRLSAKSVIHCKENASEIGQSIKQAQVLKMYSDSCVFENPYYVGNSSAIILTALANHDFKAPVIFYDN